MAFRSYEAIFAADSVFGGSAEEQSEPAQTVGLVVLEDNLLRCVPCGQFSKPIL